MVVCEMEQTKVFLSATSLSREEIRAAYSITDISPTHQSSSNILTYMPQTQRAFEARIRFPKPHHSGQNGRRSEDGVRLSSHQIGGIARAVSCKFQADTASEIAHVQACGGVTSAAAVNAYKKDVTHQRVPSATRCRQSHCRARRSREKQRGSISRSGELVRIQCSMSSSPSSSSSSSIACSSVICSRVCIIRSWVLADVVGASLEDALFERCAEADSG